MGLGLPLLVGRPLVEDDPCEFLIVDKAVAVGVDASNHRLNILGLNLHTRRSRAEWAKAFSGLTWKRGEALGGRGGGGGLVSLLQHLTSFPTRVPYGQQIPHLLS